MTISAYIGFQSFCQYNGEFDDTICEDSTSHVGTFKVEETLDWTYLVSRHNNQGIFMIFKESALGLFFHGVAMSVFLSIYMSLFMYFFPRPLIGPQVTWSDPGLSLVDPPLSFLFVFEINHATSPKLYRSYYPHRLRDSLSLSLFFIPGCERY